PLLLFHQHYPHHRHLHSFPTRRSSDLIALVRRPESAGEPIGTFPHRGRRRPRCPRRPLRRALTRHGGRPPRHSQGRRRVPPARSVVPERPAALHGGGLARAPAPDRQPPP